MELSRRTWKAILKLAVTISVVGVAFAVIVSSAGDVPQAAIVLPVIVVAFVASWIKTGRLRSETAPVRVSPARLPHSVG